MSDLISRSKLIDYFYYGIDDKPIIDGISDRKIIDIIKNQPTAYDVDKVVEELEERKALHERLVDYETKNGAVTEKYQNIKAIDVLNKAIEIVKQGGASDDVCEWKKSKDYTFDWFVGCDGCEVNHKQGDYCPRCGKKIKVVE